MCNQFINYTCCRIESSERLRALRYPAVLWGRTCWQRTGQCIRHLKNGMVTIPSGKSSVIPSVITILVVFLVSGCMRSFPCQHQGEQIHQLNRPNCCRSHHWPWTLSQHRTRHGSANPCCFSGFEYSSSCNRGHTYIHACIHYITLHYIALHYITYIHA